MRVRALIGALYCRHSASSSASVGCYRARRRRGRSGVPANPEAEAEVHRLLAVENVRHFSDISSWADGAKREQLPASPSHTIRLPLDGSAPGPHPCPGGFCADDALARYETVLADPNQPDAEREIALKYVVHLAGDLQQPLHDVDATGSSLKVEFDGCFSTLHKVWNDGIINEHGGSAANLARVLDPLAAAYTMEGTPLKWSEEGREIAQSEIYCDIFLQTLVKFACRKTAQKQIGP